MFFFQKRYADTCAEVDGSISELAKGYQSIADIILNMVKQNQDRRFPDIENFIFAVKNACKKESEIAKKVYLHSFFCCFVYINVSLSVFLSN